MEKDIKARFDNYDDDFDDLSSFNMDKEPFSVYRDSDDTEVQSKWEEVASKTVLDSDGFTTEYTWYKDSEGNHVMVFGDKDLYSPEDGTDAEFDSEERAKEWFDTYKGFEDIDEDADYSESEYNEFGYDSRTGDLFGDWEGEDSEYNEFGVDTRTGDPFNEAAQVDRSIDDIAEAVGGYETAEDLIETTVKEYNMSYQDYDDICDMSYDRVEDSVTEQEWRSLIEYLCNNKEDINESTSGKFCIMAICNDLTKKFYKDGEWIDSMADCTVFDDLDKCRQVWSEIDKSEFKRVVTPCWVNESFDAEGNHETCAECGALLTDAGECPKCDLGEEDLDEAFVTKDMPGLIKAAKAAGLTTLSELDAFIKEHEGEDIMKALTAVENTLTEDHVINTYKGFEMDWNTDSVDPEEESVQIRVRILDRKGNHVATVNGFRAARKWIDANYVPLSFDEKFEILKNYYTEKDAEGYIERTDDGIDVEGVDDIDAYYCVPRAHMDENTDWWVFEGVSADELSSMWDEDDENAFDVDTLVPDSMYGPSQAQVDYLKAIPKKHEIKTFLDFLKAIEKDVSKDNPFYTFGKGWKSFIIEIEPYGALYGTDATRNPDLIESITEALNESFVTKDMFGLIKAAKEAGLNTLKELDDFIKAHEGEDIMKALESAAESKTDINESSEIKLIPRKPNGVHDFWQLDDTDHYLVHDDGGIYQVMENREDGLRDHLFMSKDIDEVNEFIQTKLGLAVELEPSVRVGVETPVVAVDQEKEEYLQTLARDGYESGHPYGSDDLDLFCKIGKEDGFELTQNDFDKYFEYFDELRSNMNESVSKEDEIRNRIAQLESDADDYMIKAEKCLADGNEEGYSYWKDYADEALREVDMLKVTYADGVDANEISESITNSLPASVDQFLMDMAQATESIDYNAILEFGKRATEADIKELRKLRRQYLEAAAYDAQEEIDNISKKVACIVKGDCTLTEGKQDLDAIARYEVDIPDMMSHLRKELDAGKISEVAYAEVLHKVFDLLDGSKLSDSPAEKICVLCGKSAGKYGNNPYPVATDGVCCDACNLEKVIPARIAQRNR